MTQSIYTINVNVGGTNRLFWWSDLSYSKVGRGLVLPATVSVAPFTFAQAFIDRYASDAAWRNYLNSQGGISSSENDLSSFATSYDLIEDETSFTRKESSQVFVPVAQEIAAETKRVYFGMQYGASSSPTGSPLILEDRADSSGKDSPRVFYVDPNECNQDSNGKYIANFARFIRFSQAFEVVEGSGSWTVEPYNENVSFGTNDFPETFLKGLRLDSIVLPTEFTDGIIALKLATQYVPHTVWRSRYPLVTELKIAQNVVTTPPSYAAIFEGSVALMRAEYITVAFSTIVYQ